MKLRKNAVYLAFHRCPEHGFEAIMIEDESGSGLRITPSKCCGSWGMVRRWKIDSAALRDAMEYAEEIEEEKMVQP